MEDGRRGLVVAVPSSNLMLACMITTALLSGCANEDNIRKSKGYYQEAVGIDLVPINNRRMSRFKRPSNSILPIRKPITAWGMSIPCRGRFKQAEEEFREAIRIDSDYSEAHTYLGQVLVSQDQWKEAIASFRRALSNPLYGTPDLARFHLGRALLHEGDPSGALEVLEDALTVIPPNVPPARLQLELGRAYHQLGLEVRAREALVKVSTLDKGGEYATAANELLARIKP